MREVPRSDHFYQGLIRGTDIATDRGFNLLVPGALSIIVVIRTSIPHHFMRVANTLLLSPHGYAIGQILHDDVTRLSHRGLLGVAV